MAKYKGDTRIPHKLMEALLKLRGAELQVALFACRKILGWKRCRITMQDQISHSQYAKATGLTDRACSKALRKLEKRGILTPVIVGGTRHSGRRATLYHLNDNPDSWIPLERTRVPSKTKGTVEPGFPLQDPKRAQSDAQKLTTGRRGNGRSTQGGTTVRSSDAVEGTTVPPQKKESKETLLKKGASGAGHTTLSKIKDLMQELLHDPGFSLTNGEEEALKEVVANFPSASPQQILQGFRCFIGIQDPLGRDAIVRWQGQYVQVTQGDGSWKSSCSELRKGIRC